MIEALDITGLVGVSQASADRPNAPTLEQRTLKVSEEAGELASAMLNHVGSVNMSKSSEDNVLEEGCDVLITAIDVMLRTGHTVLQIQSLMDKKVAKWQSKLS